MQQKQWFKIRHNKLDITEHVYWGMQAFMSIA